MLAVENYHKRFWPLFISSLVYTHYLWMVLFISDIAMLQCYTLYSVIVLKCAKSMADHFETIVFLSMPFVAMYCSGICSCKTAVLPWLKSDLSQDQCTCEKYAVNFQFPFLPCQESVIVVSYMKNCQLALWPSSLTLEMDMCLELILLLQVRVINMSVLLYDYLLPKSDSACCFSYCIVAVLLTGITCAAALPAFYSANRNWWLMMQPHVHVVTWAASWFSFVSNAHSDLLYADSERRIRFNAKNCGHCC